MPDKRYDKAYFDRWYRSPRSRVITRGAVERKARLALAAAEYLLERPVRSVLDVGAGEGAWQPVLLRLRPRARYLGVDPSEYAVARYGERRGLRLGRFGALDRAVPRGRFDLVVCCGVLNYLTPGELSRGLASVRRRLDGVAFLEIWTSEDEVVGDRSAWLDRSPRWWRGLLREAGLTAIGLHLYAGAEAATRLAALEQADR